MEDVTAIHESFRGTAVVPTWEPSRDGVVPRPLHSFHMRKGSDEPTKFGYFVLAKMAEHEPPLSQADLARLAGVGQATISRWIFNPGRPNTEKLRQLSTALSVDYDDLMSIAGYGRPSPDISEALATLRPEVDLLAAEISSMLEPSSALSDVDREFLRHTIDRLIDPYRTRARRRRRA